LENEYKLLLDEIVLPYEKIDLTDINTRLNKLQDDIKKIPVIPVNLNTRWKIVKTNANKVPDLVSSFEYVNERMTNFEDVLGDNLREDILIVNEEVIPPIIQQLTDFKVEVKKSVTIPSDLNEKWNSVRDNANEVPGLIE
jgi:hypothetical protein